MKGRAVGGRLRGGLVAMGLVALLVPGASVVRAAEELRAAIGHAAMQPRVAPLWVAADRGLFAQEGLRVAIVLVQGAPTLLASMTARELQFGYTGGSAVLSAAAGGVPVKMLAAFTSRLSFHIVARPGTTRPEDLRGKRAGVQSIGGPQSMGVLLGLEHLGLDPVRDRIHIQVIGAQPQLVQALQLGAIDVTAVDGMFSRRLKAQGYPILAELPKANIPFVGEGVIALKATVEQAPQLVERVLRALLRATAYIYQPGHREAVVQVLARRLRLEDPRQAEEGYQDILGVIERKPYPSPDGLRNIQRLLARQNPKVAGLPVEEMVDPRLLRKLDEGGFIDALYSATGAR
ncbi:MAG: ABC transporter substrate-binding protein [Deltaproteobacteria bacterium]|nr:ABC transporter substrate-binding protein [Deltaproteobacteria bacterium]MBI3077155.1 ABC transporter substrate-binding protein [Deltaproteobacteria bacterium]